MVPWLIFHRFGNLSTRLRRTSCEVKRKRESNLAAAFFNFGAGTSIEMYLVTVLWIITAMVVLEMGSVVGGSRQECSRFFGPRYDGKSCELISEISQYENL